MNLDANYITELPILVLFPHNRCNCRCVMCDIWRIREVREIRPDDLRRHLDSFRALHVQEVVFSGGEAQLNRDLASLAQMLREEGIRCTLLTSGLLLRQRAKEVAELMDEVIVSLDGPREVHNHIRNVPLAFERLAAGIKEVRQIRPDLKISARCTVQKQNFEVLSATIATAKALGLNAISFLAADTGSTAFNREQPWPADRAAEISLTKPEVDQFEKVVENVISKNAEDILRHFITEDAVKLRGLVRRFRAELGECEPTAPRCNAPWISAVIEADGNVRPCFFQPSYGNIHKESLLQVLNNKEALRFREGLDIGSNPICRHCVCSLYRPVHR